eukprot:4014484-Prymnesium_polylepis.1
MEGGRRALRGASARRHAGRHRLPFAPPPVERLEQQAQPHHHPQRLRVSALAAGCVPARRAARDAQIDDEHAGAPLAKLPTR